MIIVPLTSLFGDCILTLPKGDYETTKRWLVW